MRTLRTAAALAAVSALLGISLRAQAAAEARVAVIERVAEALAARATLDAVLGRIDAR